MRYVAEHFTNTVLDTESQTREVFPTYEAAAEVATARNLAAAAVLAIRAMAGTDLPN